MRMPLNPRIIKYPGVATVISLLKLFKLIESRLINSDNQAIMSSETSKKTSMIWGDRIAQKIKFSLFTSQPRVWFSVYFYWRNFVNYIFDAAELSKISKQFATYREGNVLKLKKLIKSIYDLLMRSKRLHYLLSSCSKLPLQASCELKLFPCHPAQPCLFTLSS